MKPRNLPEILVKANEFKEGDLPVGGTRDDAERGEARQLLADLRLGDISRADIVEDAISEALGRALDRQLASEIKHLTLAQLKQVLLGSDAGKWVKRYGDGLSSEQIASVVKLMSNSELSSLSRSLFNPLPGEMVAMGSSGHFGSRIQPNSPGDDEEEILFSIFEGLSYGCGDVILGINPASDDLETIIRLEKLLRDVKERLALPTRYCVLSDIVKQTSARARAKVEVGFQSLAGTSKALYGMLGMDVDGLLELARGFEGLYFETGQGSAVTNHAAEGVDMVTLESRNYGLARHIRRQTGAWTIVNDVAGFIGPEVFRTPGQLLRACLEDTVMGKLHGIPMGLDICSTFHMGIDPEKLREITFEITALAEPAYLMAVAGNADPMLGYLTTSFREHPRLRGRSGKKITTRMQTRLMELGITDSAGELLPERPDAAALYAIFKRAGGEKRSLQAIRTEGLKKLDELRRKGFDLGYGHGEDFAMPDIMKARIGAIYAQARAALYSKVDDSVLRDACPRSMRVRTMAADRDDYLSHPPRGERILGTDSLRIAGAYENSRIPRVQIVISDGLNANAVNCNIRELLPRLRKNLSELHLGEVEIVVRNGRVRVGYEIGGLLDVDIMIHLIGERPGTGIDTLSAYITFGRDAAGESRWSPSMDHSDTTAVCGIHGNAKPPAEAADEIAKIVFKILKERKSGVALGKIG